MEIVATIYVDLISLPRRAWLKVMDSLNTISGKEHNPSEAAEIDLSENRVTLTICMPSVVEVSLHSLAK